MEGFYQGGRTSQNEAEESPDSSAEDIIGAIESTSYAPSWCGVQLSIARIISALVV